MELRTRTPEIFLLFEKITRKRKGLVFLFSAVLLLVTLAVIPRINVGINMIKFFKSDSTMVQDTKVFNDKLSGTGIITILIEAPERGDILNPTFLHNVDLFESYIKTQNEKVGNVMTLVPNLKRINKIMNYDQIPYGIREKETESFDFFSDDPFTTIEEINLIPVTNEAVPENITIEETAQRLGQALLDAGPNPAAEDIIKTFLAQSNYEGAAYNEIPLDPAKYGLSSEEDLHNLLSQYLVLYSGSLNMIINDSLEPDSTLITIQITNEETKVLDKLMKDISSYWEYYLDDGWNYSIGGGASIGYALSSLVTRSQLFSLVGALIIVFIIVSLMFRSFLGGLMGMIPVVFAIIGIFLFMIIFNFNLDIVTSLLAALAIGIGVDYAIHFMNAYKRCHKDKEKNVLNAVYRTTGKAIFINALSVAAGFLGLLISRFVPIQQLGILFSVSMFFACMASLIVLPMVLEYFKPGFLDK
jgi:predicted RND superfamily exporter protein